MSDDHDTEKTKPEGEAENPAQAEQPVTGDPHETLTEDDPKAE